MLIENGEGTNERTTEQKERHEVSTKVANCLKQNRLANIYLL